MKWKKAASLALAALCCAGSLAGCAGKTAEETVADPLVSLRNDGRQAEVVLGELALSPERTAVLEEIAQKYQADFPNTRVEVRSFSTMEELEAALRGGELDIAELYGGEQQAALHGEGLLLDIYPYLKAWDESATFTQAARQAVGALGAEHAYLIPNGFTQDLLYYRADWFDEYNEGRETGLARCRTWDEIAGGIVGGSEVVGASTKLGDRGGLAFAGKDKLVDYFDAMVWSSVGMGRIADPGAAYFAYGKEGGTVFLSEKGLEGIDQFLRVMRDAALPGALEWTEREALDAFLEGRAGMLLADRSAAVELESSMPEGSWAVQGFPRGRAGLAIYADEYSGWAAASSTADPEITAHFLTFLSNADNNTHYAKVCGVLPIHLEAAHLEESLAEGPLAVEMDMIERVNWYQYASEPVMYRAYEGWREQAADKLRLYAAEELSRDELTEFLDDWWTRALEDEGRLWS